MNSITFNNQICDMRPNLHQFAIKFTVNEDDAEDLVQDTLIKAIRYSYLYKEGTNLKGWLYTILKNTFINGYRRSVKKNSVINTEEDLTSHQLYTSASSNNGVNKFVKEDIDSAMSQLQPEYSVPFLRYFEGYKYHEIAEELEIPIGTVKTRIHVARKLLKTNLKMYSQEFGKSA
jgi:RNA polymerase sigma factor (sigma-70 family)